MQRKSQQKNIILAESNKKRIANRKVNKKQQNVIRKINVSCEKTK